MLQWGWVLLFGALAASSVRAAALETPTASEAPATSALTHQASASEALASEDQASSVRHFKAAIVQSGSYYEFADLMREFLRHLVQENVLAPVSGLKHDDFNYEEPHDYGALVQARSTEAGSPSIEFVPDGLYDLKWRHDTQDAVVQALKARVEADEINLILALGTNAGVMLTSHDFTIPIVVIDATEPERDGLSAPGEYSNRSNVFVQKMRMRFSAQLMMFNELFSFKKMGILVDADPDNQIGQGIAEITALAQHAGFDLVPCYGNLMGANSEQDFAHCLTELSSADIDALFLTLGYRPQTPLFTYLKPFIDRGIPVYSQYGADDVRRGALLSLAEPQMRASGVFIADVVKQIAQGVPPDRISQYFHAPLHMVFNLEVARLIQWQPSFEVLLAIDQVFTTIEN